MPSKWFPPNHDDFVRDYLSEQSFGDLARIYGIGKNVISSYGREIGLVRPLCIPRLNRRIATDNAAIVSAYTSGMSELAVSKHFNVSRPAIRCRLIEAGVHLRDQSESETLKWSGMSADARKRQVAAAHAAARGREHSFEEKCKRAQTVERQRLRTSGYERDLESLLSERGIATLPQQAVGPYNCDLGAFPVAVECWGGNFHFSGDHLAQTPKRFRYFLNAGWHIIAVRLGRSRDRLTGATADYIVTFIQEVSRNPTARRQYRVIGGAGDLIVSGSSDDDEIAIVPSFTSRRNALGQYERVAR